MQSGQNEQSPEQVQASLEEEVRRGRKFTAQEAMARLAGPSAMAGASPVSAVQQAETEIANWLRSHVSGASELQEVISRHLKGSEILLANIEQPLLGLASFCELVLASDYRLEELVREADIEWGRRMDEPPRFERKGDHEHLGDPYTLRSVRELLEIALEELRNGVASLSG
jgi:hypothetical protein